jgi:capsular exopolysaccharide synthesis family protein
MSSEMPSHHEEVQELEESFRTLRTKVLLKVREGQRCFLLTSALPGEGKTSLAVVLARSMGYMHRVLLVEADLRRPQLHNWFKIRNEHGVSDLYRPQDVATISQSSVGISVIPGGKSFIDPQEFFISPAFEQFLLHVRENYDVVLFDAPPVLAVADALLLASRVDGVIMVLRAGAVTQAEAREAAKRIRSVGGKLIGCVLTGCGQEMRDHPYVSDYYLKRPKPAIKPKRKSFFEGGKWAGR